MNEYSQGICEDGAAILKNGQMMTIEEIVAELRERDQLKVEVESLRHYKDNHIEILNHMAVHDADVIRVAVAKTRKAQEKPCDLECGAYGAYCKCKAEKAQVTK